MNHHSSADGDQITVLVAVRDPLLRLGTVTALDTMSGIHVLEMIEPGDTIETAVARLAPDVLLMDTATRSSDPALGERLADRFPRVSTLVMVDHDDEECALRMLNMEADGLHFSEDAIALLDECCLVALRTKARGCVPRNADVPQLEDAVRRVARGEIAAGSWMSPGMLKAAKGVSVPTDRRVSRREMEVLALVSEGLCNKKVADRLGIQEQTVKNHMARLMGKVGVNTRLELAIYAIRRRLVG